MKKYHINVGDTYNKLTCISFSHIGKHYRSYFLFKCDCGTEKIILGSNVIRGDTKSCGCHIRDLKKSKRLPLNAGVITQIILQYKRHARNRNINWHLTHQDVEKIIFNNCHYCGIPPSNKKITKSFKDGLMYNGIDRIDSNLDYTIDNIVPCCKLCNMSKKDLSLQDFKEWATRIGKMAIDNKW